MRNLKSQNKLLNEQKGDGTIGKLNGRDYVPPSIDTNLVNYELVIHALQEEYDRKSNEVRIHQLTLSEKEYGNLYLKSYYRRSKRCCLIF